MLRSTLLSLALLPATALGATLTVGPSGTYATIGGALNNANNGDLIEVEAGNYAETLVIDDLDVTIVATAGPGATALSGSGTEDMVTVMNSSAVTLDGFEFQPNSDRAIHVIDSELTVLQSDIHGFDARNASFNDGGAVYCEGGLLTIESSLVHDNQADDGGHIRLTDCDATLIDSAFAVGNADDDAGAIRVDNSALTIIDAHFENNNSADDGGAIYFGNDGVLDITRTAFVGNTAGGLGGAIQTGGSSQSGRDVTVVITDSQFGNNSAPSGYSLGGAVYHRGYGDLTVSGSEFMANDAGNNGGAMRIFPDSTIQVLIEDSRFRNNSSGNIGGGIAVSSRGSGAPSSLVFHDNQFAQNTSPLGGGMGIDSVDVVEGIGNTFCGNITPYSGAGLRLNDTGGTSLTWTNGVFIENQAGNVGGGVDIYQSPPGGAGGGAPAHQFWNNTFVANEAYQGGNIWAGDAKADFVNNIIAFAVDGDGFYGDPAAPGVMDYNLYYDNSPGDVGGGIASGDIGSSSIVGSDPMFDAFTQDGVCGNDLLTLQVGSPAIDSGDPALQDPDGTRSDIGAFGGPDVDPNAIVDNDGDGWPGIADCDDSDANVNPAASEVCDGIDNNCDGGVDDAAAPGAQSWYPDRDGDGFGSSSAGVTQCYAPASDYITMNGDCNDNDDTVNPNAAEVCDQLDNDCNGIIDDGLTTTYYGDGDGDGHGDPGDTVNTCDPQPAGTVTSGDDCDDSNDLIFPGAEELCDEIDNNCDGQVDEGLGSTWFRDADEDGWGDDEKTTEDCIQPSGFVPQGGDCDDKDANVNPGAEDRIPDGVDQDCDGSDGGKNADEAVRAISGCACETTSSTGFSGWLGLLGALAMFRRRR